MDTLLRELEEKFTKKDLPEIKSGQRLRIHEKIKEGGKERVQAFEGVVIATRGGKGLSGTFTLRRIASGVGVERVFPLHLPSIVKIETLGEAKTRRAKLYFLRKSVKKTRRLKGEQRKNDIWEAAAPSEPEQTQVDPSKEEEKKEVKEKE